LNRTRKSSLPPGDLLTIPYSCTLVAPETLLRKGSFVTKATLAGKTIGHIGGCTAEIRFLTPSCSGAVVKGNHHTRCGWLNAFLDEYITWSFPIRTACTCLIRAALVAAGEILIVASTFFIALVALDDIGIGGWCSTASLHAPVGILT